VLRFLVSAPPAGYPAYESKNTEHVFTEIYRNNGFCGTSSVSGTGSDTRQTRIVISELPALFKDLAISTVLDIPCGDFHWMKDVELHGIRYTGADIVKELIASNRAQYERDGIRFQFLDLIKDKLPRADLIFCRDCLVHLSNRETFLALCNICDSQSGYLLTTTFTGRKVNFDIVTGQWRPLNLQVAPFLFLEPLRVINEQCSEGGGVYGDKSLGLWRINDIRDHLLQNLIPSRANNAWAAQGSPHAK
jgi:hypothetical protein